MNSAGLDHFVFNTVGTQTAGTPFSITVTAKDASGNTVTSYTGTPTLTYSAGSISPTTMNAFVSGVGSTSVTVTAAGSGVTITATDSTHTGTSSGFTVNSAGLDHFVFNTVGTQTAGTPFSITVTAKDASGNTVTSYTGTPTLTYSAGSISPTTMNAFVSGVGSTSVTVTAAGSGVTITATDSTHTGTSSGFTVNSAGLDHFVFNTVGTQTAGTPFSITVTAKDASGNTVTSYTGTPTLTYSAGSISPTTMNAFVSGVGSTSVTVTAAGSGVTITATDSTHTGTSSGFTVNSAGLDHFVFNTVGTQTAGTPFSITVTAKDASGNTVTSYTGTPTLTYSAGSISPTTMNAFVSGVGSTSVTVTAAGSGVTITATDSTHTGTSSGFTVNPGVATHFVVSSGTSQVAGTPFSITVTAKDASGNTVTSYTGTVHFSSSDSGVGVTLPSNYVFQAGDSGVKSFSVTLVTAGTQSVTATDTVTSSITGSQTGITVNAGALDHIGVSPSAPSVTAGGSQAFVSTAYDQYNNVIGAVTSSTTWSIQTGAGGSWVQSTGTYTSATAGTWTVTALYSGKQATTSLTVNAAGAASFVVNAVGGGSIPAQTAGVAFNVNVTAVDAFGNRATGYSGTVQFTSTDAQAVLPVNSVLSSGMGTFSVMLKNVGSQTITATDTVTGTITGTSAAITVNAVLSVSVSPSSWTMDIGQSEVFTASASGGSGSYTSYQWYVNGGLSRVRLRQRLIIPLHPLVLTQSP